MTSVRIKPSTPSKIKKNLDLTLRPYGYIEYCVLIKYVFSNTYKHKRLLKIYTKINQPTHVDCNNIAQCIFFPKLTLG